MDDILQALAPVVEAFEALSIPYFVGGSLASSTYGVPRSTRDVDLIADIHSTQVADLVERLQDAYYIDAAMIREAIRDRSSFNVIHLSTAYKVDIFVLRSNAYAMEELRRAIPIEIEPETNDRPFLFSSPEDTILRKLEWYQAGSNTSDRQWHDILGVLGVQGPTLDYRYLSRWAAQLGLDHLLDRALKEAGLERMGEGDAEADR